MKRNILLLTIDAFGADKCWGMKKTQMPFMEKIGKQGVVFTNVFATTSSTTPSIASIHTGLYPREHGIESTRGFCLKDSVTTLAEVVRKNGYSTFANTGGPLGSETHLSRGFDKYVYRSAHFKLTFLKWTHLINRMRINNYLLMKEAESFGKKKSPWLYWIHLLDLHNRWRSNKIIRNSSLSDYENALISLDKKIEKIVSKIDLKNTLVVICADHGHYVSQLDPKREGVNYVEAHGFHVYDTLLHVPLLIVSDGLIPKGVVVKQQASTLDILPTIVEVVGLTCNIHFSGQNISRLWRSEMSSINADAKERPVYFEACGSILKKTGAPFLMGIRTSKWKYVVAQDETSNHKPELYDLIDDPKELNNVYSLYPAEVKYLHTVLLGIVAKQKAC